MQTLNWYFNRLRSMSPGEILWRVKSELRDRFDRLLVGRRRRARDLAAVVDDVRADDTPGFHVADMVSRQWEGTEDDAVERIWLAELLGKADDVVNRRLSYFDMVDADLGDPIDWNRDHKRRQAAPMTFCGSLDYRDVSESGDCKHVWEPNRHHQFVVLARAYRATGRILYAEAIVEQITGWLDQNPYGVGMNWRSPLELGVRLINWVWAIDLISDSGLFAGDFRGRVLDSISRHIWEIDRKYSKGTSANNHVIGEAAGAFIAASYFPHLKGADRWRRRSRRVLQDRLFALTYEDGGTGEQAVGYHLFVLQFFVAAGLAARRTGRDFPTEYWRRVESMFEFIGALSEGGQRLPMFGDADDGYVLDLGGDVRDVRGWLSAAAVMFKRGDFKAWAKGYRQPAEWLLGETGRAEFDALPEPEDDRIASKAFADAGTYLLQSGRRESEDRISVVFDAGEHGFGRIAAHAHADALSFTLRAFGKDVLVDPGTYDYFSYRKWRDYFRSTRAHNTVVIDGCDQSEMLGLFLWGRRANTRCLEWAPREDGGKIMAEHDGYCRLKDRVVHRRTLELDGQDRSLVVCDDIIANGSHDVEVYFHFAEHCKLTLAGENRYRIDVGSGVAEIELDSRLSIEKLEGDENPIGGWVSRGYHRKTASTTLAGRFVSGGEMSLICRIDIGVSGNE